MYYSDSQNTATSATSNVVSVIEQRLQYLNNSEIIISKIQQPKKSLGT
jgi:hypothetical protein